MLFPCLALLSLSFSAILELSPASSFLLVVNGSSQDAVMGKLN